MRPSIEADYNAESRQIEFKIEIYFNGVSALPLVVTRDDYLIDCNLLEELCSDSDIFIGSPSANEFSFTLYSEKGLFNPINTTGTYYGKIKIGLPLKVYCRPIIKEGLEWDLLGTYYVSNWSTDITGITADISALDKMSDYLAIDTFFVPIKKDITYMQFIQEVFTILFLPLTILGNLVGRLSYAYIGTTFKQFLNNFLISTLSFLYLDRLEVPTLQTLQYKKDSVKEVTDSNQIFSIKAKQSIITNYDGITVTGHQPQISDIKNVLSFKNLELMPDSIMEFFGQKLSTNLLLALAYSRIQGPAEAKLGNVSVDEGLLSFYVQNTASHKISATIDFMGYVLENNAFTVSTDGVNLLKVDNPYIQTEELSLYIQALLEKFIALTVPYLELTIRGNAHYHIGDIIHVKSVKQNIDFTGWLIRQEFVYDGGLKVNVKLLSTKILGES